MELFSRGEVEVEKVALWRSLVAKALVWDLDVVLCVGVWIGAPLVVYVVDGWGWRGGAAGGRGGGGWCEVKDMGKQRDDSRLGRASVAEVGEAVGRVESGEVEVAMSMGEVAEEGRGQDSLRGQGRRW